MLAKPTDNVLQIEGSPRGGRHIGAILMDEGKLTASDAEQVLKRQRELGWRFGEAAIELNLITDNDLRQALAKQYEFPYLVAGPDGDLPAPDRWPLLFYRFLVRERGRFAACLFANDTGLEALG